MLSGIVLVNWLRAKTLIKNSLSNKRTQLKEQNNKEQENQLAGARRDKHRKPMRAWISVVQASSLSNPGEPIRPKNTSHKFFPFWVLDSRAFILVKSFISRFGGRWKSSTVYRYVSVKSSVFASILYLDYITSGDCIFVWKSIVEV